ncbi:hypothetical protein [uncultured Varibaculum sp.]|uniref:hypothetical protein n=1 Tax=uncultured Varibaculum sp. TaxID=413896 RepID=UPI0025997171|nr:hypothetical protein [uncultured Varibaculum sp.]
MTKSVLAKLKQGYQKQSTIKRALLSGTFNALSTFSWYALPDYLRSRKSRSGIKILLLAGEVTWGWFTNVIPSLRIGLQGADNEGCAGRGGACECYRDAEESKTKNSQQRGSAKENNSCECCNPENIAENEEEDTVNTIPAPVAFTFAAFLLSIIFLGEKLIFSRGEKRRQAGQRYAHTKQAMWLVIFTGILSAIAEAIPDSEDELANKT